jgi:3',5'-cyclic AMP phosphodiesterase CpdA
MSSRTLPVRRALRLWLLLPSLLAYPATLTAALPAPRLTPLVYHPPAIVVQPYLQLPTPSSMTVMWETNRRLPGRVEYGTTPAMALTAEAHQENVLHEVPLRDLQPGTTYYYRVHSGDLASDVHHFRTAPLLGTRKWRMAVYGDSRSNPATHRQVAEQIAKANVDLIVHTGDIVLNGKNHDSWRKEFFEPLGPLARSVPWVSTIGNHERDSENYFSYMTLPGNERYYSFDYANARIICLDSNAWIEKGRDSKQLQWLQEELRHERSATWTFVVFHHPLFSAHATRPINALRWDWAPTFLDPANRVDGVLTGHDHFFARNYRMGMLGDKPQRGVLFLTTAGGGASLYKTKARDYVAKERSAHHFTLFEFDDDRVALTAIDLTGQEFDHWTLTKEPTAPSEFCAYEVEELRRTLRLALLAHQPVRLQDQAAGKIDTVLEVPTHFAVPVAGHLRWQPAPGWKLAQPDSAFHLEPGQLLSIPLEAEVTAGPLQRNPTLTIAFDPGRFCNRTIELSPFQLAGPEEATAASAKDVTVDGRLTEKCWQTAEAHALLGLAPRGGRGDQVRFLADKDRLYVGARLDDPTHKVQVKEDSSTDATSRLVLLYEHVRVVLSDGKQTVTFAVTPDQVRYASGLMEKGVDAGWQAVAAAGPGEWCVEMALPRTLFADWSRVRVNVVHRRGEGLEASELHLCPVYRMGDSADELPNFVPVELPERFARLVLN